MYVKTKFLSDYDVALKHLNEQYGLSIMDYKLYHPNLLKNDAFIKHYQKIHCDYDVGKPKSNLKKKTSKKIIEEMRRNDWSYEDTKVINAWEYSDSYVISLSYINIYENLILII